MLFRSAGIPEGLLGARVNGKWSAKENLGHLSDLGELDERRLREFLDRVPVLSSADMENRATEAAGHNRYPVAAVLDRLRTHRAELVRKLEELTEKDIALQASHPRLQEEVRVVDWAHFVAEHDDHHLALARQAIFEATARPTIISVQGVGGAANFAPPFATGEADSTVRARELFEIPENVTYLNCANMAPQLRIITDSGIQAVRSKATPWKLSDWFAAAEELRALAARVFGTSSDGIALVPAASYGIAVAEIGRAHV